MPSYGSQRSPSLKKMDYNNNNGKYGGGSRFSMGNIVGDPFSLATVGIAIVSEAEERARGDEVDVLTG